MHQRPRSSGYNRIIALVAVKRGTHRCRAVDAALLYTRIFRLARYCLLHSALRPLETVLRKGKSHPSTKSLTCISLNRYAAPFVNVMRTDRSLTSSQSLSARKAGDTLHGRHRYWGVSVRQTPQYEIQLVEDCSSMLHECVKTHPPRCSHVSRYDVA